MKFCPQCGGTFEGAPGFCPDDGTVLEDAPPLKIGQVLDGQYEIEAFIARGGMGTLHRARHILLGDRVVIKMLRPEMRSNTEWLRRFQREGQAARRFRHPNAVIVYDLRANADGFTYMVMEYVAGHTLDKELQQRGRFTPAEALEVLEPVARALDMAHTNGVVHRDLKPENVMLSRDDAGRLHVKLLDLGIAKLRGVADAVAGEDSHGLTVAGQILGTPYYMSPEQWGAHPRDGNTDIDGRTDIYSLGIMFYELIAGHKPFIASSLPEMQQLHLKEMPRPLNEIAPDVPIAFSRAVERAMAKDRNDRYADVGEFADELRVALELTVEPHNSALLSSSSITMPSLQQQGREAGVPTTAPNGASTQGGAMPAHTAQAAYTPTSAAAIAAQPATSASVAAPVTPSVVPAPPVKPRANAPIIVGLLVVLLAVVAGGGYLVWQRIHPAVVTNANTNANTNKNANTNGVAPAPVEALSYWIEAFDSPTQTTGKRVANDGAISLRSGQQFRFHFTPSERGYIYIIGPGAKGNAPMTFLTARPTVGLMKTNQAAADADFSFPYGAGAVLQLDSNPATEEYTVIFSPTPLLTPAFLAEKAEHGLTPDEVAALETLRAEAQTGTTAARVQDTNGTQQPAVAVNVPGADKMNRPVIFDIRIEHK
jgi:serine/threonine protein kinase